MSRFLLIGLDGFEPSLAQRWMEAGSLPNLKSLCDGGAFLPCRSTVPHATFPAWTTCVTGVNPGRHGIVDFTCMAQGEYGIRFINATERAAPAVWTVLSQLGKRVCVLGVPATYPPEKVNGVMVSGFDSPVCTAVDRTFVYPESAYSEVKKWRFADFQESNIGTGWHKRALLNLLHGVETKQRIASKLLRREPWDFFMVVFGESDTVAHHFWMFHDPNSPRHEPRFRDAIRQVYERLDKAVGQLIEDAGSDTVIGVVSDHGFGGAGTGVVHLNNWLAERGHLEFAPGRESLAKRLALSVTPEAWRGTLFRRFQAMATRAESASRFGGINWETTRAWSEELNYFPSVRINLEGREPTGQVKPRDYESYCIDLCAELESWDAISRAWRRDRIYSGPEIERAPDIIVELALEDGYSHSCLRARGGPSFRRIGPDEFMGGKERGMNGNHRSMGVLFLSEPVRVKRTTLMDVAPTIYSVLEVPGPPMDGTSLLGDTLTEPYQTQDRVEAGYTGKQEAVIEERLRDLGYLE